MHPPAYRSDEFTATAIYSYLHLSTPKTPLRLFALPCAIRYLPFAAWKSIWSAVHPRPPRTPQQSRNPPIHESLASVRSHSPLFAPKQIEALQANTIGG